MHIENQEPMRRKPAEEAKAARLRRYHQGLSGFGERPKGMAAKLVNGALGTLRDDMEPGDQPIAVFAAILPVFLLIAGLLGRAALGA